MVDDNKVIRQLIRVNLELEGFEVVTAADGAECLEVVHRVRPDVITLDVAMPRLDGLRTAQRLRADPRTRRVRVAFVSGCSRLGADGAAVDAFLAKPFEPADLVLMVSRLRYAAREGLAAPEERLAEPEEPGPAPGGCGPAPGGRSPSRPVTGGARPAARRS